MNKCGIAIVALGIAAIVSIEKNHAEELLEARKIGYEEGFIFGKAAGTYESMKRRMNRIFGFYGMHVDKNNDESQEESTRTETKKENI